MSLWRNEQMSDNGTMTLEEKLEILSDAAKYDVACTSSGVDRRGQKGMLGNSCAAGICHSFAADGRCISLLKILMTNHCAFDCSYCKNRRSNDIRRATFTPEEICTITTEFYRRNYIEGLFLSSGVLGTPDHTMEKMCETVRLLRTKYRFNGYVHLKVIPGASPELLYSAGLLADRVSVNMELPTQGSLQMLAPNKSMETILNPMGRISETIAAHRVAIGKDARMERAGINRHLVNSIFGPGEGQRLSGAYGGSISGAAAGSSAADTSVPNMGVGSPATAAAVPNIGVGSLATAASVPYMAPAEAIDKKLSRPFASAGQSTQIIIGATEETDLQLINTTQCLYESFDLKRVFYSAYIPLNEDPVLPSVDTPVPLLREHRLYQADWLLRFYGFRAEELLSAERPNFDAAIDPKCDWAIRHLDLFPVEVNTASYDSLLRVPGIGPTGVKKIMEARRYGQVNFEMLRKMHIVLKRAQYFITCGGRMLYHIPIEQKFIRNQLVQLDMGETAALTADEGGTWRQLNLFRDFFPNAVPQAGR